MLIIGGGQAGCECAFALRQQGMMGRIVIACEEARLPYERPPLSKGILSGKVDAARLEFKSAAAFERSGIEVLTGDAIISLDADAHLAVSRSGKQLRYRYCVFATGAQARPDPAASAAGAFMLRSLDDAVCLRPRLTPGKHLVIVGAGMIGLEVASVACDLGMRVDVLETAPAILSGRLSEHSAAALGERHARLGVSIHTHAQGVSLDPGAGADGQHGVIILQVHGRTLHADILVSAIGSIAATTLAEAAGAQCANGIVVDALCRTSLPDCHAIGDCASSAPFGAWRPGVRCRIESVFNALCQARLVAAHLSGKPLPAWKAPVFWSDQAGGRLQLAGLLVPDMPIEDRICVTDNGWLVERRQAGQLRVVEAFDSPADFLRTTRGIGPLSTLPNPQPVALAAATV